jgi:FkbM family methyltransferase
MASPSPIKALKGSAARALTPPFAWAVRHPRVPFRRTLWSAVCQPYLAYRDCPFTITTKYGFRFSGNAAEVVGRYIYYFGVWEPVISALMASWLKPGRTFVDVGAHFGWYSLLAAPRVGPSGGVVSVEASPPTRRALEHNVAINGFRNVRVVGAAVWSTEAELDLHSGPASNLGVTSLTARHADTPSYRVKALPLRSILTPAEIESACLLKIDVEGAEVEAIEGFAEALPKLPADAKIVMEITPELAARAASIVETMRSAGFRMYQLDNDYSDDLYFNPTSRPAREVTELPARQIDVVFSKQPL